MMPIETARQIAWRRLDEPGFELFDFVQYRGGFLARGTVVTAADGGAAIVHEWRLDPRWRTESVTVRSTRDDGALTLERTEGGWKVDGNARPDLDGAAEPDLSLTPFCNTIAVARLSGFPDAAVEFDVAYIDGARMEVQLSRQRYERLGPRVVRYIDLGRCEGFEADLYLSEDDLVDRYGTLFARVQIEQIAGVAKRE
ncbi:MAG: putative glycolipid-binding domain-containing protein [Phenylobacterium sp.]|jgi:hypothetical protein|nr:putative glycolipid-binding domain-containing protein [Phenylobacterium sp.]